MAKSMKLTLEYQRDYEQASDEIQKLCEEFPEIKLAKVEMTAQDYMAKFTIKYPIKIRNYVDLYLQQHDMERRMTNG